MSDHYYSTVYDHIKNYNNCHYASAKDITNKRNFVNPIYNKIDEINEVKYQNYSKDHYYSTVNDNNIDNNSDYASARYIRKSLNSINDKVEYKKLQLQQSKISNSIYNKLIRGKKRVSETDKYKLPIGWVEMYDSVTKKKYYACKITKHTQWLHPGIPLGTIMENGIPYGWEEEIDYETGEKYYINHVGKFTTWDKPGKSLFLV